PELVVEVAVFEIVDEQAGGLRVLAPWLLDLRRGRGGARVAGQEEAQAGGEREAEGEVVRGATGEADGGHGVDEGQDGGRRGAPGAADRGRGRPWGTLLMHVLGAGNLRKTSLRAPAGRRSCPPGVARDAPLAQSQPDSPFVSRRIACTAWTWPPDILIMCMSRCPVVRKSKMVKPAAMPRSSSARITRGTKASPPGLEVQEAPVLHEKFPPPFSRRLQAGVTSQTPAGNARKYLSTQPISSSRVARCPSGTGSCQPISPAIVMIAAGFDSTAKEAV